MSYRPVAEPREGRFDVTVDAYRQYHRDGFYVARGLLSGTEVGSMLAHGMDLLEGRVTPEGVTPAPTDATADELHARFARIHMLHRVDAMHEEYLLHPRALDVLEALIGPDVLALQTMYFFNRPGDGGQGWHQDACYITTYPDTLIGAWTALDRADTENGCLWVAPGSHHEPVYPDAGRGALVHAEGALTDIHTVDAISSLDEDANTLSRVAATYPDVVPVEVDPGDVVFFHGHLLHRSRPNSAADRWRRAFVCHYCNARSWVPWNHGGPFDGDSANYMHILARGATHLDHAERTFTDAAGGSSVAAG